MYCSVCYILGQAYQDQDLPWYSRVGSAVRSTRFKVGGPAWEGVTESHLDRDLHRHPENCSTMLVSVGNNLTKAKTGRSNANVVEQKQCAREAAWPKARLAIIVGCAEHVLYRHGVVESLRSLPVQRRRPVIQ